MLERESTPSFIYGFGFMRAFERYQGILGTPRATKQARQRASCRLMKLGARSFEPQYRHFGSHDRRAVFGALEASRA